MASSLCVAADDKTTPQEREKAILHQIHLLNQVPPAELDEKVDPGFSIIKAIYDHDTPDFATLRKVLWRSEVRAPLNPSAKAVLAGIISARWDTFIISGNLWLAGLRSPRPELREKASKRLVAFIQPAHIPTLIDTLRVPGPNILAYRILQEVTGQSIEPNINAWQAWWVKKGAKVDLVGHLLKDTKRQLEQRRIKNFEEARFWYAPIDIDNAHVDYGSRPPAEQDIVTSWGQWANTDVRIYLERWAQIKPILDRVVHQPDVRVNTYLEKLLNDPGYGDYASILLAWRGSKASLPALQAAYKNHPTVGRALARGSLGEKTALVDLLKLIEKNNAPMALYMMDDTLRSYANTLHTVGILPAEQAFQLLAHRVFDFEDAGTRSEKKKALKKAKRWLLQNASSLTFDRRRGYYTLPGN